MTLRALTRKEFLMGVAGAALVRPDEKDRWGEVEAFLEAQQAEGVFPGAALIASRNGKVAYERYAGAYCSLHRRDTPLEGAVVHPLYSYSKLVSSTVVAMAVQEGLLDYGAPASRYIPEFAGGGKERITLRHLLTHSAGIPNVALGPAGNEEEWQAALKAVCAAETEWEPGSRTAYHALTGLFVAAEAARRVWGGKPWDALCRERLFEPLGAKTLTFGVPPDSAPVALTPQPEKLPKTLREVMGFRGHPAGGCLGTAGDALRVLQLHVNRGVWKGRRLLDEKVLEEIHTVQYRREIAVAREKRQPSAWEPWGLGPLLRGEGPASSSLGWFGFINQTSPGVFGHAGIDTVIGVADMASGRALMFITTNSPKTPEQTGALRNGVTDRVFAALSQG